MRESTLVVMAIAALLLVACKREDMYSQAKSQTWDRNAFFSHGSTMRPTVPGTVSADDANEPVPQPKLVDFAMLERGRQRFNIYCTPCHGRSGDGAGMIVRRGFPRPPSLHSPRLRAAKASHYYDVITHGHGAMYSYADRVTPADRWAIIAYIRALQRSQDAKREELAPRDLAALAGKP